MQPVSYFRKSDSLIREMADFIGGRKVLEVFGGNGYLASLLSEHGVDVHSTTIFRSHDGHDRGMYFDVEEAEASAAISAYGATSDVLLMSWPTADEAALQALKAWGPDKPVIYIGETPRPDLPGLMGLSGCASDAFFESIRWAHEFESYSGNMLERAGVVYLKHDAW